MFHEKHTPTLSAPPSLHLVHLMPPETGSPEQEDPLGAQGCRYPGQNRDDARGAYDGCWTYFIIRKPSRRSSWKSPQSKRKLHPHRKPDSGIISWKFHLRICQDAVSQLRFLESDLQEFWNCNTRVNYLHFFCLFTYVYTFLGTDYETRFFPAPLVLKTEQSNRKTGTYSSSCSVLLLGNSLAQNRHENICINAYG